MPVITPYSGPIIVYPVNIEKISSRYSFEIKTTKDLINQMPSFSFLNIHCQPSFTNSLGFYWSKFEIHQMINYKICFNTELDVIKKRLSVNTRNEIKKARDTFEIFESTDFQKFETIQKLTFSHQNKKSPFPQGLLRRCDEVLKVRNKRKIFVATRKDNKWAAAAYCVFDNDILYTLMIGTDPALRKGGAVQLLIWHLIESYNDQCKKIDFCGSMLESVERVFRSFGAEQQQYLRIKKIKNPFIKLSNAILRRPK